MSSNSKTLRSTTIFKNLRDVTRIPARFFAPIYPLGYDEECDLNFDLAAFLPQTGFDEFLKGRNSQLYIIRGNHDMPSYFSQTNKKGNIHFLKDYSLLEINNKKLLLIGGAISIDRTHRVEGSSYWKDEAFNFDEKLLTKTLEGIDKVDIVVTHNAPTEFWPYELSPTVQHFLERDKPLFTDLVNERNAHSNLMKQLNRFKPRYWYYGHFHAKYKGEYEGIKYRLLDEMEIYTHITK